MKVTKYLYINYLAKHTANSFIAKICFKIRFLNIVFNESLVWSHYEFIQCPIYTCLQSISQLIFINIFNFRFDFFIGR